MWFKQKISILLIVAMMIVNTGVSTFAVSISRVVSENTAMEKEKAKGRYTSRYIKYARNTYLLNDQTTGEHIDDGVTGENEHQVLNESTKSDIEDADGENYSTTSVEEPEEDNKDDQINKNESTISDVDSIDDVNNLTTKDKEPEEDDKQGKLMYDESIGLKESTESEASTNHKNENLDDNGAGEQKEKNISTDSIIQELIDLLDGDEVVATISRAPIVYDLFGETDPSYLTRGIITDTSFLLNFMYNNRSSLFHSNNVIFVFDENNNWHRWVRTVQPYGYQQFFKLYSSKYSSSKEIEYKCNILYPNNNNTSNEWRCTFYALFKNSDSGIPQSYDPYYDFSHYTGIISFGSMDEGMWSHEIMKRWKQIDFGENPFATESTTFKGTFKNLTNLEEIEWSIYQEDLRNFQSTESMFEGCTKLKKVDMSKFFFDNCRSTRNMFKGCENLEEVTFNSRSFANISNLTDISGMFEGCKKLKNINIKNWKTSNVVNVSNLFKGCESLEKITFTKDFDVKNVTNMQSMFEGCKKLNTIDVKYWQTKSVSNMSYMFKDCEKLEDIYVLEDDSGNCNFNTSNVTQSTDMFYNCNALVGEEGSSYSQFGNQDKSFAIVDKGALTSTPGYLSLFKYKFDNGWYKSTTMPASQITEIKCLRYPVPEPVGSDENWLCKDEELKVYRKGTVITIYATLNTKMFFDADCSYMFSGLTDDKKFVSLATFTNIDYILAKKVANVSHMFDGADSLTNITLSGSFNTSSISDASYMFANCANLTNVDLSACKVDTITDMSYMFANCDNLTNINFGSNFDTSKVTNMSHMFYGLKSCTEITLPNKFNAESVTDMSYMFANCDNLTNINLGNNFDTSKVTNMSHMFYGLKSCTEITLTDKFNAASATDTSYMFANCDSVKRINLGSNFNTSQVTNMSHMFANLSTLSEIVLPNNFEVCNVEDMSSMFENNVEIKELDLSLFGTNNLVNTNSMFKGCSNLYYIFASSSFITTGVTDGAAMFDGCLNLIGGGGTTYKDALVKDVSYGVVDEGIVRPGYFTDGSGYTKIIYKEASESTVTKDVTIQRLKKYNIDSKVFVKEGYGLSYYTDQYDNKYSPYGYISRPVFPLTLTAHWDKLPPSGGGGGRGGSGGGGTGLSNENLVYRAVNFVVHSGIRESEQMWIYDDKGNKKGLIISANSAVGRALLNTPKAKSWYSLTNGGSGLQLKGGGLYRISIGGVEMYCGFDNKGDLMTGFIETSLVTDMLTVSNNGDVTGFSNTLTEDNNQKAANELFIRVSGTNAKYYLYEGEGPLRGMLWNMPITVNGINLIFDEQGRVISNVNYANRQGSWEYNPLENQWRFYIKNLSGQVFYCKSGMYEILTRDKVIKYIFDDMGNMLTGYKEYNGKKYYLEENGEMKGAATLIN